MVRRVVTGQLNGQSIVISDDELSATHVASVPGLKFVEMWTTPPVPSHPSAVIPTKSGGELPIPGATQFQILTLPPDSVFSAPNFDPIAAAKEQMMLFPGVARCHDPEIPGMHATPSVDYVIVLQGSVSLELDNGLKTDLKVGDIVIQCGARHAWRNTGDHPVTMAVVIIGDASA